MVMIVGASRTPPRKSGRTRRKLVGGPRLRRNARARPGADRDIGAFVRGAVVPGISYEDSFDGMATGLLANDTNR
jgi:hypothetical protein